MRCCIFLCRHIIYYAPHILNARKSLYYVNCMLLYAVLSLLTYFYAELPQLETLKWLLCFLVIQGRWSLLWMSKTDLKADSMCQCYSHNWTESHCFELSIRSISRIVENAYRSLSKSCATSCHFPFTSYSFILADCLTKATSNYCIKFMADTNTSGGYNEETVCCKTNNNLMLLRYS